MVHVDSPSSRSLVPAIAGALGVAFAFCAPDFCQSFIPSPVIRASCSVDLAMEIVTGRCACIRKAVLEADFGRSREPANGLQFDVLAPLATPTHHSDAPAAAIFAVERQHIRGSLVNIFSIFLPQSTGKPVASMKKK
ncbi:hypothetical protein CC77DRAFT_387472 [Alternaria alternata]|jgi:hypothetical protein|uniref:Uncharacterized protein n=1 Tax=Alternaria alternata TaxID=5599 RepID=A0A177DC39_ALTAL|nr:hypothetical protein CC77DRAFT_387472 [Alternaria alternata]OAG16682.1 hypothetical protein CC77DRAFT_387472 [Alternaria alternata]